MIHTLYRRRRHLPKLHSSKGAEKAGTDIGAIIESRNDWFCEPTIRRWLELDPHIDSEHREVTSFFATILNLTALIWSLFVVCVGWYVTE